MWTTRSPSCDRRLLRWNREERNWPKRRRITNGLCRWSKSGSRCPEDFDTRVEARLVAQQVEEALQGVYQVRVALGLPPKPEDGDDLTQVPGDLDQTFSSVRRQAALIQAASQVGVTDSFNKTPGRWLPISTSAIRREILIAFTPSSSLSSRSSSRPRPNWPRPGAISIRRS